VHRLHPTPIPRGKTPEKDSDLDFIHSAFVWDYKGTLAGIPLMAAIVGMLNDAL